MSLSIIGTIEVNDHGSVMVKWVDDVQSYRWAWAYYSICLPYDRCTFFKRLMGLP